MVDTSLKSVLSGKALKGELTVLGQTYKVYLGNCEVDVVTEYYFDYVLKRFVKRSTTKHMFTLCEM